MGAFRLTLLGPPGLSGPDGPVRLTGAKAQALLYFLAAQPDRAFPRAHVAGLLWEQSDEAEGRNSLSTTLSRLRQALPVWPLRTTGETIAWDAAAGVELDIIRFHDGVRAGDAAAAAELWRGAFLSGFELAGAEAYEEWLAQERRAWETRMIGLLGDLAAQREERRDWPGLAACARKALALDPLQERFHRALMLACFHLGDRAAALAQFATCRRLLDEELGVDPDRSTMALHEALLEGDAPRLQRPAAGNPAAPPYPPLVGRSRSLEQLQDSLRRAVRGEGRVVVLHGEAGVGKSRLIEELLWQMRRPGGRPAFSCRTALVGRCGEAAHGLPYAPFVEALSGALPGLDSTRLGLSDVWLAEVGRLLPDLAVSSPPVATDPGQERRRLFEGVARFLSALPQPLLLILEDIHWADEATQLMLAYMSRQAALRECAILVTIRAGDLGGELSRLLEELRRERRAEWLDLEPLSAAGVASLVTALIGRPGDALGHRVYAETRGNPLFAVELVRELQEGPGLAAAEGQLPLPRTVQGVIQGRVGRLPQAARDVVTAASLLAPATPASVLQRVCGLEEDPFVDGLEVAVQAGLLMEVPAPGAVPGISFAHDLIRRAVQERLTRTRRQLLHRRAYQALHAGGSAQLVEQLAHHAVGAGMWQEGSFWSAEAAAAAVRVFAYPAAGRLYEQALTCLGNLPEDVETSRRSIDLRLELGRVSLYFQPHRLEEWLAPAAAAADALADDLRRARVGMARAGALYIQGRLMPAQEALEQVLPIARAPGVEGLLAPAVTLLGEVLAARGEYVRAQALLQESARLGSDLDAVVARNMLAGVTAYRGNFAEAEAVLAAQLEQCTRSGDAAAEASTLGFAATVAQMKGDWAKAVAAGTAAISRAQEAENLVHSYVPRVFLGLAMARLGDLDGALAMQRQAVELARQMGTRLLLGQALGWLGTVCLLAGLPGEAELAAQEGLAVAEAEGAMFDAALCAEVLGRIAAEQGDAARALGWLHDALQRFERIGHLPELARCHAALALLETAPDERSRHEEAAVGLFRAMGMAWDLEHLRNPFLEWGKKG